MFNWIICENIAMLGTIFNFADMFTNYIYLIYEYKPDLALNSLQWLIYDKTKPTEPLNIISDLSGL